MSRSTIQRYLRKSGLLGGKAAKKLILTKQHTKRRLAWCKAYANFTVDTWSKVMFSDESQIQRFTLPVCKKINRSTIAEQIRLQNNEIQRIFNFVLGCHSWRRNQNNCQMPLRLNSDAYHNVLKVGIQEMYKEDSIFMHDGAPCHRSKQTQAFFR